MTSFTLPKPEKRAVKRTLLSVGSQGEVKTVNWMKSIIYLLSLLLFASAAANGVLYYSYRGAAVENRRLARRMDVTQQRLSALREDKILDMTREVIEESTESTSGHNNPPPAVETSGNPVTTNSPVAVDAFDVTYRSRNRVRFTFDIRNVNDSEGTASGYAFVMIKPPEGSSSPQVVPDAEFNEETGRPDDHTQGQSFSISHFKPMQFDAKCKEDPKRYETATVLVFSENGALWIQRDFPMSAE